MRPPPATCPPSSPPPHQFRKQLACEHERIHLSELRPVGRSLTPNLNPQRTAGARDLEPSGVFLAVHCKPMIRFAFRIRTMASTEQAPLQARCNLGEVGNNPCARLCGALKTRDENFGHRRAPTLTAIYPMVQMTSAMKNILIVDNDLGFIFWLGAALVGAGYRPWPACSLSDAISVANRKPLSRLHLLVVNASLPGVSKLIAHFRRTQAHLRVNRIGSPRQYLGWRYCLALRTRHRRRFSKTGIGTGSQTYVRPARPAEPRGVAFGPQLGTQAT